ncbi:hypothetical protein HK104_000595 [Borealophlyctis nickersoniae]|nr:hypothetical protein HK104_000595 [Borealophlyctis nickersoniae]
MNTLRRVASVVFGIPPPDALPPSVPFTDDPCQLCATPCDVNHPQLPGYLAKKIDTGSMQGSVKPYVRHILIVAGTSRLWAERLDDEEGSWVATVAEGTQRGKPKGRVIVSACDKFESEGAAKIGVSGSEEEAGALVPSVEAVGEAVAKLNVASGENPETAQFMVFPEALSVPSVRKIDAGRVGEMLASDGKVPEDVPSVPLEGKAWIFVCTHKKRDKRCGVAGPMLVEEFRKAAVEMGLENDVFVYGASHYGGHKFAGNVIIYHRDAAVNGTWYGRVRTCNVRAILETTVKGGKVFKELFRGKLNGPPEGVADKSW